MATRKAAVTTTTQVTCTEVSTPVGALRCDAVVAAQDSPRAPTGDVTWKITAGHLEASACTLQHGPPLVAAASHCSVLDMPTEAANTATQTASADFAPHDSFAASSGQGAISPIIITAHATKTDTYLEGSAEAQFHVCLSRVSPVPVTIQYRTEDGVGADAVRASTGDYKPEHGALTFAPGQGVAIVKVQVFADVTLRADGSFSLLLSALTGATFNQYATLPVEDIVNPDLLVGHIGQIVGGTGGAPGSSSDVSVKRYYGTTIQPLHVSDALYVGDEIYTGNDTVASFTFLLGGQIGINRASHVMVTSQRTITEKYALLSHQIRRYLSIMMHVATQKTPLLIQTNGGVMGVKG